MDTLRRAHYLRFHVVYQFEQLHRHICLRVHNVCAVLWDRLRFLVLLNYMCIGINSIPIPEFNMRANLWYRLNTEHKKNYMISQGSHSFEADLKLQTAINISDHIVGHLSLLSFWTTFHLRNYAKSWTVAARPSFDNRIIIVDIN